MSQPNNVEEPIEEDIEVWDGDNTVYTPVDADALTEIDEQPWQSDEESEEESDCGSAKY